MRKRGIVVLVALMLMALRLPLAEALTLGTGLREVDADLASVVQRPIERRKEGRSDDKSHIVLERRSIVVPNGPFAHRFLQLEIDRAVTRAGGDAAIRVGEREEEAYTEVVDGVTYPAINLVVDILIVKHR
ncbi:hypothetical protein AB4Z48_25415 [Cupriavidus sp. 2TAF22]|uniref:hypothetical protein n=1 Tax=unclassified Cupriavidus TaxID=2640874 RepID=UPI003F91F02F